MLLADYVIQGKVQELVVKFLEVINTSGVTEDADLSIEVVVVFRFVFCFGLGVKNECERKKEGAEGRCSSSGAVSLA